MSRAAEALAIAGTAERRCRWRRIGALLLVGLLLLPARTGACGVDIRRYEETKFQVLGEYLATKLPGSRVLFITSPASEYRTDYATPAFIQGMAGCTVTVATPSPFSGVPLCSEQLFTLQDFDMILATHPGHSVVVCSLGLPSGFESSAFWQIPAERRPKLALPCGFFADALVEKGIENHDIAVVVMSLFCRGTCVYLSATDDVHERFRTAFLLVDAENLDQVRRAFPEEFRLNTPPDMSLRRLYCPPPTFCQRTTVAGAWCGGWLIVLTLVMWGRCRHGNRKVAASALWPSLLPLAALLVLLPVAWWVSELCDKYLFGSPLILGATSWRLADAVPDFLSPLLDHPLRPLVSAGLLCVIAGVCLAWCRPRWLSELQRACLMMTAFAAGVTLLLTYPRWVTPRFYVWGWPLPVLGGVDDTLHLGFLALDLACFLLPLLALAVAYAGRKKPELSGRH